MNWAAFSETMLLLILASFIVERSLAVMFETSVYIDKFGTSNLMKPLLAIIYSMIFVAVVDINVVEIIGQSANDAQSEFSYTWAGVRVSQIAYNLLVITLTGMFIAGGSKASLKLFRDVLNIKSTDEAMRKKEIKPAPAFPIEAAKAAAGGNTEAEIMLYNMFDASNVPKANK